DHDVAILKASDKAGVDGLRYAATVSHDAMYPCLRRPGGGGLKIEWPPGRGVFCDATVRLPFGGGTKEFSVELRDVTRDPDKIDRPDGRKQSLSLEEARARRGTK